MRSLLFFLGSIALCVASPYSRRPINGSELETVFEWKYIDYNWVDEQHKGAAIARGEYDHKSQTIIDVDRARDGRTFVTVIRNKGVPASLSTVSKVKGPGGPLLEPYPNWAWTIAGNCLGITSVYRVAIDHCDRMWVLDTGHIGDNKVCPAQLLAFDLTNDRLIHRIRIPDHLAKSKDGMGLLVTPVVDAIGAQCTETIVYIADVVGHGLIIYESKSNSLWRLNDKVYKPDPNATQFHILGDNFHFDDGVLGMALTGDGGSREKTLYFRPLASFKMFLAPTRDLLDSKNGKRVRYYKTGNVLPSQSAAQAFSDDGTLFFGLTTETSIACWNRYKPFNRDNLGIAVKDEERLQFASGVKIVPRYFTGYDEELWVATNRLQKIMNGNMNYNDVNFRIMRARVDRLTQGTVCERPYRGENQPVIQGRSLNLDENSVPDSFIPPGDFSPVENDQ